MSMSGSLYGIPGCIGRFFPRAFLFLLLGLSLLVLHLTARAAAGDFRIAEQSTLSGSRNSSNSQPRPGRSGGADLMKRLSENVREGDIIFQTSASRQSLAIKIATGSDYTHCGILLRKGGALQVFEAAGTVQWTPLETWVKRGVGHRYLLMRLNDPATLTPVVAKALRDKASAVAGKKYDLRFQWSDDKLYCSELVWKLYHKAGIDLCGLRSFRDYKLNHDEVRKIIRERYDMELPLDESVVAPSDLTHCGLLKIVDVN